MVRNRKAKVALFKSANGISVKLDILIRNNILKVEVSNFLLYSTICKRGVILMILVICNLISLILNILNVKFATAIFILILLDLSRICTTIKEENLVVIRGLGFQLTTKYVLGVKTAFIPQEKVQNIFINEIIFRNRVVYVLSLLTKDATSEEKLIPLLFDTLPRLTCLKVIYKHIKALQ